MRLESGWVREVLSLQPRILCGCASLPLLAAGASTWTFHAFFFPPSPSLSPLLPGGFSCYSSAAIGHELSITGGFVALNLGKFGHESFILKILSSNRLHIIYKIYCLIYYV